MAFNQTIWGNLSITILMWLIPLLPILFIWLLIGVSRLSVQKRESLPAALSPVLRWFLVIIFFIPGFLSLLVFSLPYSIISSLLAYFSPDGQIASFNETLFYTLKPWMLLSGGVLIILAALPVILKNGVNRLCRQLLKWIIRLASDLILDWKNLVRDIRDNLPAWSDTKGRLEIILVALLTLCGLLLRVVYINRPFLHDEAYTYVGFASRTLRAVVTDYSLPNNHVFHTILVFFSTQIFGPLPWAVRLPAFISGVLLIPAIYLLARRLYNPSTAILAAALTTCFPDLVTRSTGARGYLVMTLLALLVFWLSSFARLKPNRMAWLLVIVLSSLGFYTLPIMLYPYGGMLAWLAISALLGEIGPGYRSRWVFLQDMIVVGLCTILCTLLLYSTILIGSGSGAFFGNGFIKPLSPEDFFTLLPLRISDLSHDWQTGLPFDFWIILLSLVLSVVLNKKITGQWTPWLGLLLLWIFADLLIQRPDPNSRLWSFLLPLLLMAVASAWNWLFDLITKLAVKKPSLRRIPLKQAIIGVVILLCFCGSACRSWTFVQSGEGGPGLVENMVMGLAPNLQRGDWVISVSANEPPLWYYFKLHQIPWSYLDEPAGKAARRYLIIVYTGESETVDSILDKRKIPPQNLDLTQTNIIQKNEHLKIYAIPGTSYPF